MPNVEFCQGGRKEEALSLSLQSITESVDLFTTTRVCRWESLCPEINKCFVLLMSKVATDSYRMDAQDLDSDQQGNLGQLSADTAHFYQFNCALRLIAKPQLEKGSPPGIQLREF